MIRLPIPPGRSTALALVASLLLLGGVYTTIVAETRADPVSARDSGITPSLPEACRSDCETPFGEVLGVASGNVPAYSNCNAHCVTGKPEQRAGTFLGIRWQCVEFARRWLYVNEGAIYGEVDIAADIWREVSFLTRLSDGERLALSGYPNGSSTPPQKGDLLVYADEYLGTGHVAVVTGVEFRVGTVEVAEQNYDNRPWKGDHARQIELVVRGDRFWLLDPYLIGWKHAESL
jgi:glutathionylspermidine amidase/synthetase